MSNLSPEYITLRAYDGAGNDFFVLDARLQAAQSYAGLARRLCNRAHELGGGDGLLVLHVATTAAATARLIIYNADGSEAEMCGNGARCAVRALDEEYGETRDRFVLETVAGLIPGEVIARGSSYRVRIDVGAPRFEADEIGLDVDVVQTRGDAPIVFPLVVDNETYQIHAVSFGNPHAVLFVPDTAAIALDLLGPRIEKDTHFRYGTNVHVVTLLDRHHLRVRHWERGSGMTLACGTGAAAAAVAAICAGLADSPVTLQVPGGTLQVEWTGDQALLEGPVARHGRHEVALHE